MVPSVSFTNTLAPGELLATPSLHYHHHHLSLITSFHDHHGAEKVGLEFNQWRSRADARSEPQPTTAGVTFFIDFSK
jgi:hypothetical protein